MDLTRYKWKRKHLFWWIVQLLKTFQQLKKKVKTHWQKGSDWIWNLHYWVVVVPHTGHSRSHRLFIFSCRDDKTPSDWASVTSMLHKLICMCDSDNIYKITIILMLIGIKDKLLLLQVTPTTTYDIFPSQREEILSQ